MGLFNFFQKKSTKYQYHTTELTNHPAIKRSQDIVKKQDQCYRTLDQAALKYEQNGDIDSLLSVYQKIFFDSGIELHSQTKAFYPVEICIKNGWNDKAWAYLNRLLSLSDIPVSKIRFYQGKILKKEKKYLDAIEMYMFGYLAKSQWNNTFQPDMFKKEIQSSAKRLSWTSNQVDYLSDLIQSQVNKKDYSELHLRKLYEAAIDKFKNLREVENEESERIRNYS